jgi:hypothetical protein
MRPISVRWPLLSDNISIPLLLPEAGNQFWLWHSCDAPRLRGKSATMDFFFSLTLQPSWTLIFQFRDHFTDGRIPWTSDQPVARPLSKHRTTQIQKKHIHIPNIHALCGSRNRDPGFRGSKDSTCLRPLGYRDRRIILNI